MVIDSLVIECSKQLRKLKYDEISHLYYLDGVITIELANETKAMCCSALKELEEKLPDYYVRINRNAIINIAFLIAYYKQNQKVTMENGKSFTVTRRNIPNLVEKIRIHYPIVK